MAARSKQRNPYRPGTASHARLRAAELARRRALATATARRTNSPDSRRRAQRRASAATSEIQRIEGRRGFREKMNAVDRAAFDTLSMKAQDAFMKTAASFPDGVPASAPDPFEGPQRSTLWRLYYSTRAGIRLRAAA